ncbi:hypothetical protein [Candidatus Poriferisodalis multihospitum]|uniref:hypothetical protein n=1 Tax=Candidatus Poriferisodalis multihospitum TaxID=2983191 RepID=UPI00228AA21B|nr:hypothetical protein [Candidatus Poriferisodalis multihospitum]MCY3894776.1 hypothetical protein [Acidimicrobiaceae bacterium]MDE0322103.1 hypothetical protein [Acidimicrobiaceae bacterium]
MPVYRDFSGLTIAEALDQLADQKDQPEVRHLTLYEIRLVRAAAELLRERDDRTPVPIE